MPSPGAGGAALAADDGGRVTAREFTRRKHRCHTEQLRAGPAGFFGMAGLEDFCRARLRTSARVRRRWRPSPSGSMIRPCWSACSMTTPRARPRQLGDLCARGFQPSVMRTDRFSVASPASSVPAASRSGVNWGKSLPAPLVLSCAAVAPSEISTART